MKVLNVLMFWWYFTPPTFVFTKYCYEDNDCGWCGVCVDNEQKVLECFYPFQDLTEDCELRQDLCTDVCQNGGYCDVDYGFKTPTCTCNPWYYYGKYCEHRIPEGDEHWFADGITVLFSAYRPEVAPSFLISVKILATVQQKGRYLEFFATSSEGSSVWFKKFTRCSDYTPVKLYPYTLLCTGGSEGKCSTYFPNCKYVYSATLQFPYKPMLEEPVLTRRGEVIGYVSKVTITAKNDEDEVFRHTYPILVIYKAYALSTYNLQYVPVINVDHCGKSLEQAQYFYRRSTIELGISITHKNPWLQLFDDSKVEWTMRKVGEYRDSYIDLNLFQVGTSLSWTIPRFRLDVGKYKVHIIVLNTPFLPNFADCYIEIESEPLVAFINGGTIRVSGKTHGILLSAEGSYDPNEDDYHQDHLRFHWLCQPNCQHLFKNEHQTNVYISNKLLTTGATYRFTLILRAHSLEPDYAYQEVYISEENSDVSIYCLINCLKKVVSKNPLCLAVGVDRDIVLQNEFVWTFREENGQEESVDSISDETSYSYLMCTLGNVLKKGKTYHFQASWIGKGLKASITIEVAHELKNGSCYVTPSEGIAFKTLFNISCSGFTKNSVKSVFTYEFYDKSITDLDSDFSGRMIAENKVGILNNVKLSRGNVVVLIYDSYGSTISFQHKVNISFYDVSPQEVKELFIKLEKYVKLGRVDMFFRAASVIPDILDKVKNKDNMIEKLIQLEEKIKFSSLGVMKEGLSLMYNIFTKLQNDEAFKINQELTKRVTKLVSDMSITFKRKASSNKTVPFIARNTMEELVKGFTNLIQQVMTIRNDSIILPPEMQIRESDFDNALFVSKNFQTVLHNIAQVQIQRQVKGTKSYFLTSASNLTYVGVNSDRPANTVSLVNKDEKFPFLISPKLEKLLSTYEKLTIHSRVMKYNPFWTERRDISSELVDLLIGVDGRKRFLTNLSQPVNIYFQNIKRTNRTAIFEVRKVDDGRHCDDYLDTGVTVLRLDLPRKSMLFFKFLSNDTSLEDLRFRISKDVRPDCDFMRDSDVTVPSDNVWETVSNENEESTFVYIGVTPGDKVPLGESFNVSLTLHYKSCLTWLRYAWVSEFCKVVRSDNISDDIHCSCTHASVFSFVFAIPPNEIDPLKDISLFVTLKDNIYVAVTVICLLVVYLVLSIWAVYRDRKDNEKRKVVILSDNFPHFSYCYVVAVYTGCRMWAGTDSNIGIRIFGSNSHSLSHILKSSSRRVLQSGCEDWFMIRTLEPLGVLHQVHLWHDSTGFYPDWYCDKIVVYDVKNAINYHFFVEDWVSMDVYERSEVVVVPATVQDLYNLRRVFVDNAVFGFRSSNMLGNVLFRHPRNKLSRLDRVTMLITFCFITIVVSIAFYGLKDENRGVDDSKFTHGSKDVIISIQTFMLTMASYALVVVLFKTSYKPKVISRVRKSLIYVNPDPKKSLLSEDSNVHFIRSKGLRRRSEKGFFQHALKSLHSLAKPSSLLPVSLIHSTTSVHNRKLYFLAYVVCLLTIALSSIFTILYGLRFGKQKSNKWLCSVFLVLLGNIIILSPIKIVLFSIIFATAHERLTRLTDFDIEINNDSIQYVKYDESVYLEVLKLRSHRTYKPLPINERDSLIRKRKRQKRLKKTFDLAMIIILLLLLCLLFANFDTKMLLQENQHVKKLIHSPHPSAHSYIKELLTPEKLEKYILGVFVKSLYKLHWYNDMDLSQTGNSSNTILAHQFWTDSFMSKLIKRPSLRQVRVVRVPCNFNKTFNKNVSHCVPPWSSRVEDRDEYSFGWRLAFFKDVIEKNSPWTYKELATSKCHRLEGLTGTTYPCGGYFQDLSFLRHKTMKSLQKLQEGRWIDTRTRAVFAECKLFNLNTNSFSEVTLLSEQLPLGFYLTRLTIHSVKIDPISDTWKGSYIFFILFLLYFIFDCLVKINRYGFCNFISKFSNLLCTITIVLGFLSVLFFVLHLQSLKDYYERYEHFNLVENSSYEKVVQNVLLSFYVLTLFFCCLVFLGFSLLHFRKLDFNKCYVFVSSKTYLLWTFLTGLVFSFVLPRIISFILTSMYNCSIVSWRWTKTNFEITDRNTILSVCIFGLVTKLCVAFVLVIVLREYRHNKTTRKSTFKFSGSKKTSVPFKRYFKFYKNKMSMRKRNRNK